MRRNVRWCGSAAALLFALGLVFAPATAPAQGWSEDFEGYTVGELLKDQAADDQWTTWDDSTNPAADGAITDIVAASGDNSLEELGGADVIGLVDGVTDGTWTVKVKYFLPAVTTGNVFFIMMAKYPDNKEWAYQLTMNLDAGTGTDGRGSDFPLVRDDWAELQFDIDLDANAMVVTYNGAVVNAGTRFTDNTTQIQAFDLYSEGGGSIYIDDISVTPADDPGCGPVLIQFGNHDAYQPLPDPAFVADSLTAACDGAGVVVNGTGADIWGGADSAHYLYDRCERIQGNFDASVLIQSFGNPADGANDSEWGRAGFMVRETANANSPNQFLGVSTRGLPAEGQRRFLHSSRDVEGAGTADNRQDDFSTPIYVRMRRVGDSFTSFYKYAEGDDWTEFATRTTVMPYELLYGFGIMNHGGNSTKPPFEAAFCDLEITKLSDAGVSGIVGLPAAGGVELTWTPTGPVARYEIRRTDDSGEVLLTDDLAGAETSFLDDTPIDGVTATYSITAYDTGGLTPGSVPFTYSVGLVASNGAVTTWVLSPHYGQGGGANPPRADMALDYLTDGAGIDESNFIPGPGATVATDYTLAASTGCNAGSNPNTSCDPPTFFLYQTQTGTVDFNGIFGDINDVMTYMVTYVTNTTDAPLPALMQLQPDDGAQVLVDNTTYYFRDSGCCNLQSFSAIIPPGEHRLMVKVFEGGGGHNGNLRILDWYTGQPFDRGVVFVDPRPTMTEVPAGDPLPPAPVGMDTGGNVLDWLISAHLQRAGGANPPNDVMARDYITDGAGVDETTLVPVAGTTVATDYAVAESTGCTCGSNPAGCSCDPVSFFQYTSGNGEVNFNNIYGDVNDVMTYMVTYVTNTTDDVQLVRASLKPDDGAQVLLDNETWYFYNPGCCAFRDFLMPIAPGEHRLMVKIFEGGGGHNGHLRLFALPGVLEVSSVPTITEVPESPAVTATRVVPPVATGSDLVTVKIKLEPADSVADVHERLSAPWGEPANISGDGVYDPVSRTISWIGVSGTVSYDVVPFTGQPDLVGIVDDGSDSLGRVKGLSTVPYLDVIDMQEGWMAATITDSGLPMSSVVTKTDDSPETFDMSIEASGSDIWGNADDLRYVFREIPAGSCVGIQARLDSFDRTTSDWGKAALMLRTNVFRGSPHTQAAFRTGTAGGLPGHQMQWRDVFNGASGNQDPLVEIAFPYWVRGVYQDGQYTGYFAPDVDGQPGEWVASPGSPRTIDTLDQESVLIGVAVTSHDDAATATAEFSNVQIFDPCKPPGIATIPGDADLSGQLNITDAILVLGYLFLGDSLPECATEEDGQTLTPFGLNVNDIDADGAVNITDPIAVLNYLFLGGPAHVLGEGCQLIEGEGCEDSCLLEGGV